MLCARADAAMYEEKRNTYEAAMLSAKAAYMDTPVQM